MEQNQWTGSVVGPSAVVSHSKSGDKLVESESAPGVKRAGAYGEVFTVLTYEHLQAPNYSSIDYFTSVAPWKAAAENT